MSYTIHDLPKSERPRERLLALGARELSGVELVAILLGMGTQGTSALELAGQLLAEFGGLSGLVDASVEELRSVRGMGPAKAIQLKAALELATRLHFPAVDEKAPIRTPNEAYLAIKPALSRQSQECVVALLCDTRCHEIGVELVAKGGLHEVVLKPRDLFHLAVRRQASSLIIAHNHPSGELTPSTEDKSMTEQLVQAGRLLGISVADHLVVGETGFVSIRERFPSLWRE